MSPVPTETVAGALRRNLRVAAYCSTCGAANLVDLHRLSAEGRGRQELAGMRLVCDCGDTRRAMLLPGGAMTARRGVTRTTH